MSSSFMYVMESSIRYEPKYAIDGKTGNGKEIFKSIHEHYPWFAIDFEQPRTVDKIMIKVVEGEKVNKHFLAVNFTFFVKIRLKLFFLLQDLEDLEIRVGDELINNRFAQPLSDRNNLCGNIQSLSSSLLTFTLECQKTLIGRYLSIQVMSYGQLHLDEVKIEEPEPGTYLHIH